MKINGRKSIPIKLERLSLAVFPLCSRANRGAAFELPRFEKSTSYTLNKMNTLRGRRMGARRRSFMERSIFSSVTSSQLDNGSLTVGCELLNLGDPVNKEAVTMSGSSLSADLQNLLSQEAHADCELVVDGNRFRAHKGILASRSPVFCAMFHPSRNMIEAQKSECEIEDLTPTAVRSMLQFIYTDTCPQLSEHAEEILPAADKYQLARLKAESEMELSKTLTPENVIRRFKLADKHSAKTLKERALLFLRRHVTDVLKSPAWAELKHDDPVLTIALLEELIAPSSSSTSQLEGMPACKRQCPD